MANTVAACWAIVFIVGMAQPQDDAIEEYKKSEKNEKNCLEWLLIQKFCVTLPRFFGKTFINQLIFNDL
jgi:hypothetical protein